MWFLAAMKNTIKVCGLMDTYGVQSIPKKGIVRGTHGTHIDPFISIPTFWIYSKLFGSTLILVLSSSFPFTPLKCRVSAEVALTGMHSEATGISALSLPETLITRNTTQ